MTISFLVNQLPEIYQPIYGHPEFDERAVRPCSDRFDLLLSIYKKLERELGRPLRVLDLGCAQGYFGMGLAEHGAQVRGIDQVHENIHLCQHLAQEHPSYSIQFDVAQVEDVIERLEPATIDLVLGMSVMHHICAAEGTEKTRTWIRTLSKKVEVGVFEVALKEEPVSWAEKQPQTPDWLYQDFAFLVRVGVFSNHLSETSRPIYFASNSFWFSNKSLTRFEYWTPLAHEYDQLRMERGRRYFHSQNQLMKLLRLYGSQGDINKKELEQEIEILSHPDLIELGFPQLIDFDIGPHEGWVLRQRIDGTLLSTCLFNGDNIDRSAILNDLLKQLAALESTGLFHQDIRSWNALVRKDGSATWIDYGSITREQRDCAYPQDWRLPLLILLNQLFGPQNALDWPPILANLHPSHLKEPAANLVWKFWNDPPEEWSWARISREWSDSSSSINRYRNMSLSESLRLGINAETQTLAAKVLALEAQIAALHSRARKWDQRLAFLKPLYRTFKTLMPEKPPSSGLSKPQNGQSRQVPCPVCQHSASRPYFDQNWQGYAQYQLLQCNACGCIFTDPMPSNERLSQLYKTGFDYRWYADHYNAKLKDCRIRVKEYAPLLGQRVLDFGGGVGYFSSAAREFGLESITYDPYVSDKPPQSQHWDCVVALHVLEHSNNLDQTLSQIKDLLIPGGNLVLAVPNADGLGYQRLGMGWVWAQPPLIHIFHFTAAGLTALLSRHGFENIRISYHERWDANHEADVLHAEHFRRWDSAWALPLFRAIPGYRKIIASVNSWRRFRALGRSTATPTLERAELQVIATLSHP